MLVVGLTGGIGSGKTTTAHFFAELGVPIIDADVIARELTQNPLICQQLSAYFGPSILKADRSLDREQLRQLIFNNPTQKKWLEQLLHPLIIREIKKQLEVLEASYCIVVIPLLFETGPHSYINRILVVESPDEERLLRTQKRDKVTAKDIEKIIKNQATSQTRLAHAEDLIINNSTLEELQNQVAQLHESYLQLSKSRP